MKANTDTLPVPAGARATGDSGVTLVELLVVVTIVGILAAVAIPVVSGYARESRLSEAVVNVQGIIEAEEAFFVRFQRYTVNLGWCPNALPAAHNSQNWPGDVGTICDGGQDGGAEWAMLGWRPDDAVIFQYRVFTAYGPTPATAQKIYHPVVNPPPGMTTPDEYGPRINYFGINWTTDLDADLDDDGNPDIDQMNPWCAVEARADWDGNSRPVYIRSNSINRKHVRFPHPDLGADYEW